jgi:hypothetical protein
MLSTIIKITIMISYFLHLGFQRSSSEQGIYMCSRGASRLIVGVYVNELIITGTSSEDITAFKLEMKRVFLMRDLCLLSYYLGIEVNQSAAGISLCQSSYATKLLERSGMNSCNPSLAPKKPRLKMSRDSTLPLVNATE